MVNRRKKVNWRTVKENRLYLNSPLIQQIIAVYDLQTVGSVWPTSDQQLWHEMPHKITGEISRCSRHSVNTSGEENKKSHRTYGSKRCRARRAKVPRRLRWFTEVANRHLSRKAAELPRRERIEGRDLPLILLVVAALMDGWRRLGLSSTKHTFCRL